MIKLRKAVEVSQGWQLLRLHKLGHGIGGGGVEKDVCSMDGGHKYKFSVPLPTKLGSLFDELKSSQIQKCHNFLLKVEYFERTPRTPQLQVNRWELPNHRLKSLQCLQGSLPSLIFLMCLYPHQHPIGHLIFFLHFKIIKANIIENFQIVQLVLHLVNNLVILQCTVCYIPRYHFLWFYFTLRF